MTWRVAKSLDKLLAQINELAPNRDKASDGALGDADHQNRTSDHNPHCGPGVVTARDFDHDPAHGADMVKIAEALRHSKDPRIKYVISQYRMFSSYPSSGYPAWTWRPYSGINAHTLHMHVSVQCNVSMDSTKEWSIGGDFFDMATEEQLRKIVREEVRKEITDARKILAVGKEQDAYNAENINLKKVIEGLK